MSYVVARAAERVWTASGVTPGLHESILIDGARGASHLEIRLCRLEAGATTGAHRHPFEESWFVFSGDGRRDISGLTYDIARGDYGVSPVGTSHAVEAGTEDLVWLCVRAPKPPIFHGAHDTLDAEARPGERMGRPSETDPRHLYAGHFDDSDVAPYAQLSMPGYHGPNIKNISIRMMVDRLLGAQHHTLFVATIAPLSGRGHAAGEHYHPFEEIYLFVSGGMRGTLDGDTVTLAEGDLVWVGVDATHGFVNENDEPARWLEVQSPVPPDSHAFFFPDDWRDLPHRASSTTPGTGA